jgi:hypothetical protein
MISGAVTGTGKSTFQHTQMLLTKITDPDHRRPKNMLTPRRPQINGASRFNRKLLKLQRTISVAVYDEMQHVQLVVEQRQFNTLLFKKRLPRLSITVEICTVWFVRELYRVQIGRPSIVNIDTPSRSNFY